MVLPSTPPAASGSTSIAPTPLSLPNQPEPSVPSPSYSVSDDEAPRPQAGPLPMKRGEIGYREDLHARPSDDPRGSSPTIVLPSRHPADRDAPPPHSASSTAGHGLPSPSPPNDSSAPQNSSSSPTPPSTNPTEGSDANASITKRKRFFNLFGGTPRNIFGFSFPTLLLFTIQLGMVAATIVVWVLAVRRLVKPIGSAPGISNAIFIHVVFAVAVMGQLLFLERRIYRLRAERYTYLHPGALLPMRLRRRGGPAVDPVIGWSPWSRPPLPTYAAALAESGVGTGDVEDPYLAAPPPPAYGNTRGSVLLLSGYLRDSLRLQRPPTVHSRSSRIVEDEENGGRSRPLSYATVDGSWQVVGEDVREQRVQETLGRLERSGSRSSARSGRPSTSTTSSTGTVVTASEGLHVAVPPPAASSTSTSS